MGAGNGVLAAKDTHLFTREKPFPLSPFSSTSHLILSLNIVNGDSQSVTGGILGRKLMQMKLSL